MREQTSEQKRLLQATLRSDFASFIHKCFTTINPHAEFLPNWHIDLIASRLDDIEQGNHQRLIINMPPRSLKSICISVAWPAWLLGHTPTARIIVASYTQSLSVKHSLDCKLIMQSAWYRELFPQTVISKTHNIKSKFLTTQQGFRLATSVDGSVTGEGGDYLIIDDPHNPTTIHSIKKRTKVIEWYEQTFSTRLNNKTRGTILLVMQRLHEQDLAGHLLSMSNNWQLLKIPAIATEDVAYQINNKLLHIKTGDIMHNSRENMIHLQQAQHELGTQNFAAQYQQEPLSNNSSLLKLQDINFYKNLPEFNYVVQSWDTAIKVSNHADYSVCTTWAVCSEQYFLIDMVRKKFEYSDLKKAVIAQADRFKPKIIIIEDKASGQALIQDLTIETTLQIIKYQPVNDKITRFATVIPYFQNSKIRLPEQASWLELTLRELTAFPNSKNDDIVDSISQFITIIKQHKFSIARIRLF